tara:strand:+ start:612 stop:1046 length:435 start_codon:yes stop_codon:yes gene_type:complete
MQALWRPFSDRLNELFSAAPKPPTLTAGFMSNTEYQELYHQVKRMNPKAAERLGLPGESPFLRGRAAVLEYPDAETEEWVKTNAPRYGVLIDSEFSWLARPTGDRFKGAGANRLASGSDLLEAAMGSMFYENGVNDGSAITPSE